MSGQTSITPKDFAVICCKTHEIREASYDKARYRYNKHWAHAAEDACVELGYNPQWGKIVHILLFPGYSDVWDWCSEVNTELKTSQDPSNKGG